MVATMSHWTVKISSIMNTIVVLLFMLKSGHCKFVDAAKLTLQNTQWFSDTALLSAPRAQTAAKQSLLGKVKIWKCAHKALYKVCKVQSVQIKQSVRIKPNGVELPQPCSQCSGQPGGTVVWFQNLRFSKHRLETSVFRSCLIIDQINLRPLSPQLPSV